MGIVQSSLLQGCTGGNGKLLLRDAESGDAMAVREVSLRAPIDGFFDRSVLRAERKEDLKNVPTDNVTVFWVVS